MGIIPGQGRWALCLALWACLLTFADENPSENIMISAMSVKSGTIMDTGRSMA